jgi:DNA-binding NtrC family response regulator
MRVLVVDDDPSILRTLALLLGPDVEVVTALSVAAALTLLEGPPFDVVVADLRLPDRWGDELLAHVAARAPATRRLLLTGDSDPERTVRELLDSGVVEACFRKPRADGLLEAIRGGAPPPFKRRSSSTLTR